MSKGNELTETIEFSDSDSTICELSVNLFQADTKQLLTIKNIHSVALNETKEHMDIYIPHSNFACVIKSVQNISVKNILEQHDIKIQSHKVSIREITVGKLNPFIYEIELQHGNFAWTVFRRYNDFLKVHEQLLIRLATFKIPIPTKKATAKRLSFKEEAKRMSIDCGRKKHTLSFFPKTLEIFMNTMNIDKRKNLLQTYLQSIFFYTSLRELPEILKFLEVSYISFIGSLGMKRKEGIVKKRSGGRTVVTGCLDFMNRIKYRWRSRWLFVKDTFVAYFHPKKYAIGDVILVDSDFSVVCGHKYTGYRYGILITNKTRRFICSCQSSVQMIEWRNSINNIIETSGKDFIQMNKHDSFAPLRPESYCKWYIDGQSYMNAVGNALEIAKEEIYIADWWLSPQLLLKRPSMDNYWRIDKVLLRKANQGVFIFILLFKEIEMALNINSKYSKQILSNLHPHIQVLRHPDHLKRRVFLWSHHEKLVIVDQKIALLGGIDLCFGRWDNFEHPIQDISSFKSREASILSDSHILEFVSNPVYKDTIHLIKPASESLFGNYLKMKKKSVTFESYGQSSESTKTPKNSKFAKIWKRKSFLTIHDNINNCNIVQLSRPNFSQYYKTKYALQKQKKSLSSLIECSGWTSKRYMRMRKSFVRSPLKCLINQIKYQSGKVLDDLIPDTTFNNSIMSNKSNRPKTLFIGKDYVNWIVKDCKELDKPDMDSVDRDSIPRMPWHDIGCAVYGKPARDAARHFIQRWNVVKKEKSDKKRRYSMLIPKSYQHSEIQKLVVLNCSMTTCQMLRSISKWSGNINSTECSILNAYIETIRKANRFIYIENQFFISATTSESHVIKNEVSNAIIEKIMYFHNQSKLFRVFIILPLLPAFETDAEGFKSTALYTVLHYIYLSLFRGPNSLFENLIRLNIDPFKYIFIGGLRHYGYIGNKLCTEMIYVHSKLLIVDDLYAVIGSANLNDRSMLGYRDSETAFYFEDEKFIHLRTKYGELDVGQFCSTLRKALMSEHLGLSQRSKSEEPFFKINLLDDPVQDSFFVDIWCATAQRNTSLFEEIFACIPTDQLTTLSNFNRVRQEPCLNECNPLLAREKIKLINGFLVVYPTKFLCEENLEPAFATRERYVPVETWL